MSVWAALRTAGRQKTIRPCEPGSQVSSLKERGRSSLYEEDRWVFRPSLLDGRRGSARRRGQGGAPAAQRGRTTLGPSRADPRMEYPGGRSGWLGQASFG